MEEDYINDESLSGDASNDNVESSDESKSVSDQNINGLSLDELNSFLGKTFPTKEAALKSIKDTYSYVGKKKEDIAKEVMPTIDTDKFISKEQYENDMFFSKNQNYDTPEIRKVLQAIAKSDGVSIKEASESEAFTAIFSAVDKVKKDEQTKSVLSTNPRLAASKNALEEAKEARKSGDEEKGRKLAVRAVLESLEK